MPVPAEVLRQIEPGRGRRGRFPQPVIDQFLTWLAGLGPPGRHGDPSEFDSADGPTELPVPLTITRRHR